LNILHVITGLEIGGAEGTLFRLCMADKNNRHLVVCLMREGYYGPLLREHGVPVIALNASANFFGIFTVIRLFYICLRERPDVVQTWMYHSDFIGGIAARIAGIRCVVWGIRNSILEKGKSKATTIMLVKVLAILSRWVPKNIIVCSKRALEVHESVGYDRKKMHFVANGYDLSQIKENRDRVLEIEAELNLEGRYPIIGSFGRFDPYKDYKNLFDALAILDEKGFAFQCLLAGRGMVRDNLKLIEPISEFNILKRLHFLGERSDIQDLMGVLDLYVLSSSAEAFPNVVAEAMASGTPCVVTHVGDAAFIVGDTGWIVPPRDPVLLADAIESALMQVNSKGWSERRAMARNRIEEKFGIDHMVNSYHRIWQRSQRVGGY
jgi:glycosyltransferase involved in cell wall biosynthesis